MKYIILILSLISISAQSAENCAPASKEMAQYFSQKNWRPYSLTAEGTAPVNGFVDEKNNFYYSDISRSGQAAVVVKIDHSNKSYSEFFKYCRNDKSVYLRLMRRGNEGNKYKITLRYLPQLSGFANDPLATQRYREDNVAIRVKFEPNSSIDKHDTYPNQVKSDFVRGLNQQLAQQPIGMVELDLTNWDDVVCDFIHGKVKFVLDRDGYSDGPLVEQKMEIEGADLRLAHRSLKEKVASSLSKEKTIFQAARTLSNLEQDRKIEKWVDKKGYDALKGMMNSDMSKIVELDEGGMTCLLDQLQSYSRPGVRSYINLQFKAPSLDELDPAGAVK